MKPPVVLASLLALCLRGTYGWGGLGHITTAYLASHFVSNTTENFLQELLDDPTDTYLAAVATWADSVRYTKWGRFSKTFHFIDSHDRPPASCGVDLERDCKPTGCVVSAMANYTRRTADATLPARERAIAVKFVVHLVGDAHQPLHAEDVARGGNGILVRWHGRELNLHHVWDSSIAEKLLGPGRRRLHARARAWADRLAAEIADGKFAAQKAGWLEHVDIADPSGTAMRWARESNGYVCTHVFPEGVDAVEGHELSGAYYEKAAPVIELQVARAGYRMAAWLDMIVDGLDDTAKEL